MESGSVEALQGLHIEFEKFSHNIDFSWYYFIMEIIRNDEILALSERFKQFPALAILGPRQCGKTTLARQFARQYAKSEVHFFDLEYPPDLAKLENPTLVLDNLTGIVVIDEIQRRPDLFPVLRVLIDRNKKVKFLILGSASRDLIHQSSESLAGRIGYMELGGFQLYLFQKETRKLWMRGGLPRSFLAKTNKASFDWRQEYISSFIERDIPNIGFSIPPLALRRFWTMLSHYHGQIFDASEISHSLQISDSTARRYLDLLTGTFMIRQLRPWFYNTKKRLVKRPKLYFRDSGLLHAIFSVENYNALLSHPKLGASWEGFALEQFVDHFKLRQEDCFFWATHQGAEVDLVFQKNGRLWGVECKYNECPKVTKSMKTALQELSLAHLWVLHPGHDSFKLDKAISSISVKNLPELSTKL